MAKYKSKIKTGGGVKPAQPAATRGLIPCGLIVLGGILLLSYLFYSLLSSSAPNVAQPASSKSAPSNGNSNPKK